MPDIRSFCGSHYNPQKIEDIATVVAEPYDVISPAQQAAYYKTHPYNIIRLILGKHHPQDNKKNNQYTRARDFFKDWQKRRILLRDPKESIYIYTQTFPHNNKIRTRTGFIVLLKLEDFAKNTILPHENTFSQPVQDRLKLLQSCKANLSPIFAMFCDPQRKVNGLLSQYKRKRHPFIAIKKDKVLHRLWRMSDKREIRTIRNLLKGRKIFIADGHHRYEAALNYKRQMQRTRKQLKGRTSFNYVMTYLVATADPGLTILATHRVLKNIAGFRNTEIISNLKEAFKIHKFSASDELFSYMYKIPARAYVLGSYFGKNKFYALKLKNAKMAHRFIDKVRQGRGKDLDVTILHSMVIERILNLVPSEENIYYTRDAQEAIKSVKDGKYQLAFFLRPPKVRQVKRAATAGEKMPHKSTYFYPKPLTGLVINKLE